jgi:hypothetical protein
VRAVLEETFRLLAAHLSLFTLISLTVWLPGHVVRNYLEFFTPPATGPAHSLQAMLAIQVMFDPLVVCATVAALGRIKLGLPVGYGTAMVEGLAAWGRLLLTRFVINVGVALPALGALLAAPAKGAVAVGAGALFLVLAALTVVILIRVAVVDSVVVLERGTALTAWGRAASLTAGQRWPILGTLILLFLAVLSFAFLVAQAFRAVPDLNHFVPRVLLDCAVAVTQSLFTIALFLFYWRARAREGAPRPVVVSSP